MVVTWYFAKKAISIWRSLLLQLWWFIANWKQPRLRNHRVSVKVKLNFTNDSNCIQKSPKMWLLMCNQFQFPYKCYFQTTLLSTASHRKRFEILFYFFFLKSDTWAINNLDSSEIYNIHHNEFIDSKRLHLNCLSISASNIQMSFVEINFIKAFECDEKLQCKNFYEGLLMVDIWVLWDRNLVAFSLLGVWRAK